MSKWFQNKRGLTARAQCPDFCSRSRWLECSMNRVSDGDRSTLFSFVSCGASQGYAPQSDEVISILRVLFPYVGIGTRLALTSMGWLTMCEFIILVPDPIAFAPRPVLPGSSFVTVVDKTHHHLPSGHVCSVELVESLGCGRRDSPRIAAQWGLQLE